MSFEEKGRDFKSFIPHRVFINHADTFAPKHITEYLVTKVVGQLKENTRPTEETENESLEEEQGKVFSNVQSKGNLYEFVGTRKYLFRPYMDFLLNGITESQTDVLVEEILNCRIIIYDITNDPKEIPKATAALKAIESFLERNKNEVVSEEHRIFILISTVMTWANTKPIDPDDPDLAFTEADYKKRKAHPNYKLHLACEKEVIQIGKKFKHKLKTYVICCGILYGLEEQDFSLLFKMAWENSPHLFTLSPSNNIIPMLHIEDLARIVHAVIEFQPKKPNYILAVEPTQCTQRQFVRALGKHMGLGKVKDIPKEEAFLYDNLTQDFYSRLILNLKMEPTAVVDNLLVEFKSGLNIAENMPIIVSEYRKELGLIPKRIFLHGPPASGKTTLAKMIAEHYRVKYISVKCMIDEIRKDLFEAVKAGQEEKTDKIYEEEGGEEEEDDENSLELKREMLREIEVALEQNTDSRLTDEHVIRLMKTYLQSNVCQNQGYVLDGFPKTTIQAVALFAPELQEELEEEEDVREEEVEQSGKVNILPTHIFTLCSSDDFLCERIMNLPESEVQGTHYVEEDMLRRLDEFHKVNHEDATVLNFFDELEIHPIVIDIEENDVAKIFEIIKDKLGMPIGFELTDEEREKIFLCQTEKEQLLEEQENIQRKILEQQALEEYQAKMEEKIKVLEELQLEEEKILAAQCEPLRSYLMTYVFPTLTEGLLEVARVKPRDPVDYLAEYLFKNNPEGKMFDPAYTRQGELVESMIGVRKKKRSNTTV